MDKKELEYLSKRRKAARSAVTRCINNITEKLKDNNLDELEVLNEMLTQREADLKMVDEEFLRTIEDETLFDNELVGIEEYSDKIINAKVQIRRVLNGVGSVHGSDGRAASPIIVLNENEQPVVINRDEIPVDAFANMNLNNNNVNTRRSSVKLPKLQMMSFDGDLLKFQNWWDQYKVSIHDNEQLTKIEKFCYLKGLLVEKAQTVINGIPLTEQNYELAIEQVRQRFGNPDILINTIMNKLMNLEPVFDANNVKRLRILFDTIKVNVRNLATLGVSTASYSALLAPVLLKLLPNDLVVLWLRDKRSREFNVVKNLIEYLQEEIEGRERAHNYQQYNKEKTFQSSSRSRFVPASSGSRQSSTSVLTTQLERKCFFCSDSHWAPYCTADMSVDSRREIVKKNKLCFICLRKGHCIKDCRSKRKCLICNGRHHELICYNGNKRKVNQSTETEDKSKDEETKSNQSNYAEKVYLPTFDASMINGDISVDVIGLIDSGSQRSFVRSDAVRNVGLRPKKSEYGQISAFGGKDIGSTYRNIYDLRLINKKDKNGCIVRAIEMETICNDLEIFGDVFNRKADIDVLIGCDNLNKVLTGETEIRGNGSTVFKTIFGNSLSGRTSVLNVNIHEIEPVNIDLRKFWEIESLGIKNEEKYDQDENLVKFNETISYHNQRYTVGLIWRDKTVSTPCVNMKNARVRFNRLSEKLNRNIEMHQKYADILSEYLKTGIIEEVKQPDHNFGYYMPHRAVVKEKGTTQVRIVFDASSKENGLKSLNECLFSGCNLFPEIFDILIRFRTNNIVLLSDIEKAFLQIEIREEDRDFTKFLWRINGEQIVYRFKRVPFGIVCSPFLLNATIRYHLEKFKNKCPDTYVEMKNNFYVDDLVTTHCSVDKCVEFFKESKMIMAEASMNLRKWTTNNEQVMSAMSKCESGSFSLCTDDEVKVLGLLYSTKSDTIKCNIETVINFQKVTRTKRTLLSQAAKIFDPLGILSPFTVRIKILMQSLWERGSEWDEPLPQDIVGEWDAWNEELINLKNFWIERKFSSGNPIEIHCFTDASEKAFAACVYSSNLVNGYMKYNLICAKTRVAPIKKVTLPRLELLAAVIGVRLVRSVKNALRVNTVNTYYWCDSQIVLCWIKNKASKWKTFVANRVSFIQSLSQPDQWNFVSGKENIADKATRGLSGREFIESIDWLEGPAWLSDRNSWPVKQIPEIVDVEAKTIKTLVAQSIQQFSFERFSSYEKLLRTFVHVLRFIRRERIGFEINTTEINKVEEKLIEHVQQVYFREDCINLRKNGKVKNTSNLFSLCPFIDGNIMRAKGRLKNLDGLFEFKYPIILPYESRFTELLVMDTHQNLLHLGVQTTLSKIREKYLILNGRKLIRNIVKKCIICRRFNSKTVQQETAPLPKDRLTLSKPFDIVGIDFAGPLFVRDMKPNKSYICLFTCANVRAIHLEVVSNMSTDTFINALKRFISRRGLCSVIYTDNAKTFKCAEKELAIIWSSISNPDSVKFFSSRRIKWKYIAERSPWWGGFYERLVRTTKTCLKKILGKALLSFEELTTVLTEVEAVINSRPISYVYNEVNEPSPISPNNFLLSNFNRFPEVNKFESKRKEYLSRLAYKEKLLQHYWNRWYHEYLTELNNIQKKNTAFTPLKVGDVMLLREENTSRQNWKLCVIEKLFPGTDGIIRTAIIRTPTTILKRSVNHLCPLEVN